MLQDAEEEQRSLQDYANILIRRRYHFCLPAMAIVLFAVFFALGVAAIYRSEATILIEDQQMPEDIVGATIRNYASQQIQLISQRVLTVTNINAIVDKFEVYGPTGPGDAIPPGVLAEWFREDMEFDVVSADLLDPRGRSAEAAVAFTLAFNSVDPETAQKVTEELVALFLSENRRSSALRTSGVSALLASAISDANEDLLIAEARLAEFKASNEGALPDLHQLNLDIINRTEQKLSDVNLRIQELEQRKLQLSAQLSSIAPAVPVTLPSGETIMSDRERLRVSLVDYRRKAAIYQPGHPDLVRLKREIETLQNTVGDIGTYELTEEQLRQERVGLEELRSRYSQDHPNVREAEAAVAELESQLVATDPADSEEELANNPAYVLINTQLQAAELEVQNLVAKRGELQASIAEHEELIRRSPQVEMQYEALLRSYDNAKTKYRELQAKLRAAEVAASAEQEITGLRFTLIEPPALPLFAEDRDQVTIIMLGVFLAIGSGIGLVVLVESMDRSIHSAKELVRLTGSPPFAVIPYLDNSIDIARAATRRNYLISAFLLGTALSVIYVMYLV